MQSISETYRVQLEELHKKDEESRAKTKITLQKIRSLISKLESIEFVD
jgi:hypothetical protein